MSPVQVRSPTPLQPADSQPAFSLSGNCEEIRMDPFKKLTEIQPTKKAFSLWDEFRRFAFKGNVIDLAVAVVIGAAFGKIIDSLVKDIIMPLVSVVLPGDQGYQSWTVTVEGVVIP